MRRRVPECGVVVCAAWLAAVALVRADAVIPWQSAGTYEGDLVTVEGDVARARLEADTCILEFSATDETAFRVVLIIPLLTDLPRQPQRLYEGKRVRVSGKVTSWQGRPEMIVRTPDAIEVVGVAANAPEAPPAATVPPPAPVAPRRTAPPPTTLAPPPTMPPATLPSPATAPPSTMPPATLAPRAPAPALPPPTLPPAQSPEQPEEAPRLPRRVDPCDAAHERWRRAAADADARAGELSRCLRGGSYRCRAAAAAMGPALSELEWAEQQVEAACP